MKLICTMPVRNEDWVLGLSARAVLRWCDELVIGLHACTDGSKAIALAVQAEHPGRVEIAQHPEPEWAEMLHRQRLLDIARERGATHIVIVDADEVLTGNLLRGPCGTTQIRWLIAATPEKSTLQIPWLCLAGATDRYYSDGVWSQQQVSMAFQDAPELHWSSAGRGGYDYHNRHPMGAPLNPYQPLPAFMPRKEYGLMHLQFVSDRRLRAKQAKYKCDELLRWPGREPNQVTAVNERYNVAVYGQKVATGQPQPTLECPATWWAGYGDLMHHLKPNAEPWQESEVRRLIREYPKELAGLDLFGLEKD